MMCFVRVKFVTEILIPKIASKMLELDVSNKTLENSILKRDIYEHLE